MLTYILRRLLLMPLTLLGITFVVFMLIALSPGGIGAGLQVQAGGAMQAQSAIAVQRAKMEDRYGLNEPWPLQYLRWLGRISPIKLGQRDLISPSGDLITRPRPIPEPALWQWVSSSLPATKPDLEQKATDELSAKPINERTGAFADYSRRYVETRAAFTTDDALLRDAIKRYLEAIGRKDLIDGRNNPKLRPAAELTPDKGIPEYSEIQSLGAKAVASWASAVDARAALVGAMASRPYPEAGIAIIPGVLSLSWPDLGVSFSTNRRVIDLIAEHLPVTLLINLIALPLIYLIAIPSGMLAATFKGSFADVGLGIVYIALFSVPTVLAGVLCLGFLATPDYLNLFPTAGLHDKASQDFTFLPEFAGGFSRGYLLDLLWHLALPVICSVYGGFAVLSKLTRGAMLDNFNADYVRTAKAKGVSARDVVFRHVFRNSLLPLITVLVLIFPAMLAGSVVIERIFTVPGMGYLVIEAIGLRDREMILANTTIIACVTLMALLLADILYAVADPRIAYK
jgi:microcin C transport system permease protein